MFGKLSDKAKAAKRRGDQFEKRRKLTEAWAWFCEPLSQGNVIAIHRAQGDNANVAQVLALGQSHKACEFRQN